MAEPTKETKQKLSAALQMVVQTMQENGANEMRTFIKVGEYSKADNKTVEAHYRVEVKKVDVIEEGEVL